MAKSKTLTIDAMGKKSSFDLDGITKIKVKNLHGSDFFDLIYGAKAKGSTISFTGINGEKIKFKNCKNLKNISLVTDTGLNEYVAGDLYDKVLSCLTPIVKPTSGTTVTGSIFNDYINLAAYSVAITGKNKGKGLTIKANSGNDNIIGTDGKDSIDAGSGNDIICAGADNDKILAGSGNDTITGGLGNDTITGGSGTNTIIIQNEAFGNDTINLTKGEKLILDMSAYPDLTSADSFIGKIKISGDNLVLYTDNGKVTLKNFAKSNVVSDGYVKIRLNNGEFVDLNTDEVLSYADEDFTTKITKNKKGVIKSQTATFKGSRFDETIEVTSELNDYTKTINTGKGRNTITLTDVTGTNTITGGSGADILTLTNSGTTSADLSSGANVTTIQGTGTNTIVTGKGNDTFIFGGLEEGTSAKTTLKAGAGINYIRLGSSKGFGNITLSEEKVKAKNIIIFESDSGDYDVSEHLEDYLFSKSGNDLIITNDVTGSSIKIKGYYFERTSKTKYAQIEFMIDDESYSYVDFLTATGKNLVLSGSGTITGTPDSDTIIANDSADGVAASNDTITGGKGNDIINAGKGKNTIIIGKNDGNDTIINGGGTDTIEFTSLKSFDNLEVGLGLEDDPNLYITYGDGKEITVKDYKNGEHSVKKIKIGKTTKKIESLIPEPTVAPEPDPTSAPEPDPTTAPEPDPTTAPEPDPMDNKPYYGENSITGNDADDIIHIPSGLNRSLTIDGGKGDDYIASWEGNTTNNCQIYGGDGNDELQIDGGYNTIYGGKGNDYMYVSGRYEVYNRETDDYEEFNNPNTVVFNNGDGNDLLYGDNLTLKFADTLMEDLTFQKFGNNLVIKYNDGQDSASVKYYFREDDEWSVEARNTYTVEDKNGVSSKLVDLVNNSGNVPESTVTTITGNDADDIIHIPSGLNRALTIDGGKGDDYISSWEGNTTNNCQIYGGDGNDELIIDGGYNTVYGGKGNDYMNVSGQYEVYNSDTDDYEEYSYPNTVVFNNGDGNDLLRGDNLTLKFADTLTDDLTFEKFGDNLVIKYNDGQDSVAVKYYFRESERYVKARNTYTVEDKNGVNSKLVDLVNKYTGIRNVASTTITGTSTDDYMMYTNGDWNVYNGVYTINANDGDDYVEINLNNSTVNGGDGNDVLRIGGKENIINGGKGNDHLRISGSNEYKYNEETDEYELVSVCSNTVVFHNGDGNDDIGYETYGNITLKFADTLRTDLTFERMDNDLFIKYNSGADSIRIQGGYSLINESQNENKPIYTIEDKNGTKTSLKNFVNFYGDIPEVSKIINGTSTDDYMMYTNGNWGIYNGVYTINANDGDDYVEIDLNSSTVNGGEGNDVLRIGGKDNIINPGKGNDHLRIYGDEKEEYNEETGNYEVISVDTNTVILHNGDGNDDIGYETYGNITLKFADTLRSDLTFERMDNDLFIRYNSGADSIRIQGGYTLIDEPQDEHQPIYTIEDKNGETIALTEIVNSYMGVPTSTVTTITGNDNDDIIHIPSGINRTLTIDGGKGDDYISSWEGNTTNNCQIYGGDGNDELQIDGGYNTIYGGKGNDYMYVSGETYVYNEEAEEEEYYYTPNTVVFNNGDGNDLLRGDNLTLKFADTLTDDLTFEKFGENLVIKYNDGQDSVAVKYYFRESEWYVKERNSYTVEDKNGVSSKLVDLVDSYVGIPISKDTVINGTNDRDYLKTYDNARITEIYGNGGDDDIEAYRVDGLTVEGGTGNDDIYVRTNNSVINGGSENDMIHVEGTDNVITGGTGNDIISTKPEEVYDGENWYYVDTENTIVFKKGDGNDVIRNSSTWVESANNVIKLQFTDASLSDFSFEKYGTALLIKYSNNDSILLEDYYYEPDVEHGETYYPATFKIVESNGRVINLANYLSAFEIEDSNDRVITGTNDVDHLDTYNNKKITEIYGNGGDDDIEAYRVDGLTVDGGAGNDDIYARTNNSVINGGSENDVIHVEGTDNVITAGTGNDIISTRPEEFYDAETYNNYYVDTENTIVFKKGDGNDVIRNSSTWMEGASNVIKLQFTDASLSDFSFEKYGTALLIKYSNNDSIFLDDYYYEPDVEHGETYYPATFKIVESNDRVINLSNYLSAFEIEDSKDTMINGTNDRDHLDTYNNAKITKIYGNGGDDDIEAYRVDGLTVDGGAGNDDIYARTNNSVINGGSENDIISVEGTDNVITAGTGNDEIHIHQVEIDDGEDWHYLDAENTIVFKKGDGNDVIRRLDQHEALNVIKLQFTDSSISDLSFEKYGTALRIKYSNNDSILLEDYYYEPDVEHGETYYPATFKIVEQNGTITNLATIIEQAQNNNSSLRSMSYVPSDIDSINNDIAAFSSSGSSDAYVSYSEPNVNDALLATPQFQNADWQQLEL